MNSLSPSSENACGAPPDWETALGEAPFTGEQRWRSAIEIRRFLRYCEILEAPVTRRRSREYLARVPPRPARPLARLALRWFFAAINGKDLSDGTCQVTGATVAPHAKRRSRPCAA